MRFFNAFQLMLLFAASPFLITYCESASFYAHTALMWVLIVGYIVGFAALVTLVGENLK